MVQKKFYELKNTSFYLGSFFRCQESFSCLLISEYLLDSCGQVFFFLLPSSFFTLFSFPTQMSSYSPPLLPPSFSTST